MTSDRQGSYSLGTAAALLIDARPQVLDHTSRLLRTAGLDVITAADISQALEAARNRAPDIVIAAAGSVSSRDLEALGALPDIPSPLPLIFLTSDTSLDACTLVDLTAADFVLEPLRPQELIHRVTAVLGRVQRTRQRRAASERLREKGRQVSALIRSTNDPQVMAQHVVSGLGAKFGSDHAWLQTFEDSRVPLLATGWSRAPEQRQPPPLSAAAAAHLAAELWAEGSVLDLSAAADGRSEAVSHFAQVAADAVLPASVAVPLGQGGQPFGLIWFAKENASAPWTPTETALLQHVAGNLAHGLVQGHLITAQREVLIRLHELDRAKTEFVATVNHELRTPLTSITGYLEMIADTSDGKLPNETERMLEIVGRNAHRLQQLIEDLLTLSRYDAQDTVHDAVPVAIADLLATVAVGLAPAAAAGAVQLELGAAPEGLQVEGDMTQLEQVFTNLVSNAIKFTPSGGRIRIDAGQDNAGHDASDAGAPVWIRIQDTGIGIPPEDLPRLFTRFFRASNAMVSAIPGTGLGLAIVQDIVEHHGGKLTIDSVVNEGTTVTVRLPCRREQAPLGAGHSQGAPHERTNE